MKTLTYWVKPIDERMKKDMVGKRKEFVDDITKNVGRMVTVEQDGDTYRGTYRIRSENFTGYNGTKSWGVMKASVDMYLTEISPDHFKSREDLFTI